MGVLESEDTMKYYYCDSWRVLIVDENNMDLHHRVRIMTFKTQDLDDLVGCG